MEREVIILNPIEKKAKKTMSANERVLEAWEKFMGDIPNKSDYLSAALVYFMDKYIGGKVCVKFDIPMGEGCDNSGFSMEEIDWTKEEVTSKLYNRRSMDSFLLSIFGISDVDTYLNAGMSARKIEEAIASPKRSSFEGNYAMEDF